MRLVNQLAPLPLESLESLLDRLRQANYYDETTWVSSVLPPPLSVPNLLRSATHYAILTELTGLDVDTIYNMTLHRFTAYYPIGAESGREPAYDDIDRPLVNDRWLARYGYGRLLWQICPVCWREEHVLRLPWALRHVTTCPIHQVLLVDTCSGCGHRLHPDRASGACMRCGCELANNGSVSIAEHPASLLLTRIVWSAVGCSGDRYPPADLVGATDHPLHRMDGVGLLRFMERWAELLVRRDPGNPLLTTDHLVPGTGWASPPARPWAADVQARHGVLVAVSRLLLDWPGAWFDTLERISMAEGLPQPKGHRFPTTLYRQFPGAEWAWLHASWRDFVRDRVFQNPALYPWLRYSRDAERAAHAVPTLLNQQEAIHQARVGPPMLRDWITQGLVRAVVRPVGREEGEFEAYIDAASLSRFLEARERALSPVAAAHHCGLTLKQLGILVEAGRIHVESEANPWVKKFTHKYAFLPEALDAFVADLLRVCPEQARPDDRKVLGFKEAATQAGKRLVGFLDFMEAIRIARIPARRVPGATNLAGLWFERRVVLDYRERARTPDGAPLYTLLEACRILHCSDARLQRWVERGLLHTYPVPRGRASRRLDDRYDSREVDSFWDRYITKDAAITLLDQPPLTFERWLQQGVLPIADGGGVGHEPFLFDREALVQWRQERLTSAEAMRLLGFNHGTMRHWVGTGKLRPIPGMGERRQWFWRAEVEEWAGDRITAAQAGELIGIPAITVNRWSRIGKLPMAEHAGQDHRLWFSRRAILEWRNERLTIEEAATLCRVHPASVLHWEERGHITRITPPTHRPVWFARADIERWMAERVELARNNGRYRSRGTGSVSETISQASP